MFRDWGYQRGRVVGYDGLTPNAFYPRPGYAGSYLIDSEAGDDWVEIRSDSEAVVFRSGDSVIRIFRV